MLIDISTEETEMHVDNDCPITNEFWTNAISWPYFILAQHYPDGSCNILKEILQLYNQQAEQIFS